MATTFTHNFGNFKAAFEQAATGLKQEIIEVVKMIPFQALADLQTISPVATGAYRATHDLTINTVSTLKIEPVENASQMSEVAEQRKAEAAARLGAITDLANIKHIFIANNQVYANALEWGHSRQAPNGIYAIVTLLVKQNIAAAMRTMFGKKFRLYTPPPLEGPSRRDVALAKTVERVAKRRAARRARTAAKRATRNANKLALKQAIRARKGVKTKLRQLKKAVKRYSKSLGKYSRKANRKINTSGMTSRFLHYAIRAAKSKLVTTRTISVLKNQAAPALNKKIRSLRRKLK